MGAQQYYQSHQVPVIQLAPAFQPVSYLALGPQTIYQQQVPSQFVASKNHETMALQHNLANPLPLQSNVPKNIALQNTGSNTLSQQQSTIVTSRGGCCIRNVGDDGGKEGSPESESGGCGCGCSCADGRETGDDDDDDGCDCCGDSGDGGGCC
ncbi:hypothetical protein HK096_000986, partial [Nowakowskiella sp. JEL0078]